MMKHLLHTMALLAAIVCNTASAWAEQVVYAVVPSSTYGAKITSFDYELLNNDSPLTVTTTGDALEGITSVLCGTNVGEKYYAFINYEDENTGDTTTQLVTINFTTGKVTVVNGSSYKYGKAGYNPCGMARDEKSGTVYVIEQGLDDSDDYATFLYTLDVSNGALTLVNTYGGTYEAITTDGDGGFYLIKNKTVNFWPCPELYHMSSTLGIDAEPCVSNDVQCSTTMEKGFCLAEDGKHIIYTLGANVYEFDLEAKTFSKKGSLSKSIAGITTQCSTEDGTPGTIPVEDKPMRILLSKTTYGDNMGYVGNDVDMKREVYFYGYDNQVNAIGNYARNYGSPDEAGGNSTKPGNYVPAYYTKSIRDEFGNIVKKQLFQYGLYDFGDTSMELRRENTYEYDEKNRLVKDHVNNYKHTYVYDEDNNLVKDTTFIASTGKYTSDRIYSEFIAPNKPTIVVSSGLWESDKYTAQIEYDENYNKVQELHAKELYNEEFGLTEYLPIQLETWTYDGDVLKEYNRMRYNAETYDFEPEKKTVYTPVNGDTNKIMANDSSYFAGKWYSESFPCLYTYGKFDEETLEMTKIEVAAEKDAEAINDVKVQWTVPMMAFSMQSAFAIYRDGQALDTLGLMDCIVDYDNFICQYVDKQVKSGSHDYFVLPLFSSAEFLDGDEPAATEPEWSHYYASDIATVDATVELPAATNLRLTSARTERVGSGLDVHDELYGTIAWEMPVGTEELERYGFISNDLMLDKFRLSEAVTDAPETTSLEGNFYNDVTDVYILTRYVYGKAFSEHISVALTDLKGLVGIQQVSTASGTEFTINGRHIALPGNASATVFNAAGVRVAKNAGNDVDLTTLAPGTYVLCIEENGTVSGYKFSLK